jgi:hypothetical protein
MTDPIMRGNIAHLISANIAEINLLVLVAHNNPLAFVVRGI